MLSSVVSFVEFSLLGNCYISSPKEAGPILYQNLCSLVSGVLMCNCYQGLEGATWAQVNKSIMHSSNEQVRFFVFFKCIKALEMLKL